MGNKWVEHVKKFSKKHNISYSCAITDPLCKSEYKKIPYTNNEKERDFDKNFKGFNIVRFYYY